MDIETLISRHELSAKVFGANFGDLTHDESLVQPQGGGNRQLDRRTPRKSTLGHARLARCGIALRV